MCDKYQGEFKYYDLVTFIELTAKNRIFVFISRL